MKEIRSILDYRLPNVTIRTSQTTANRLTERAAQNAASTPFSRTICAKSSLTTGSS